MSSSRILRLTNKPVVAVLLVLSEVLLLGCHHHEVGDNALGFTLPNVRGGQFSYQPKNHRNLLIAFLQTQPDWSSQSPSRACVPSLLSMDHQYRNFGVDVVIVDASNLAPPSDTSSRGPVMPPSADALLNTSYDWSLSVPLLADPQGKVARLYGITQVPTLILVDANGRIAARWTSMPHPGNLAAGIQQLVGGPMANKPILATPHD